jgi:MSHA biogenesis protein MshN
MSLINQVLQDLEKRHASASEMETLPPHVRAVPAQRPEGSGATRIVVAVVLVALAVAAVAYVLSRRAPEPAVPAAAGPVAPAVAPQPVSPPPAPVAETQASLPAELIAPASKLSEELSFVPDEGRARKAPAAPAPKPAPRREAEPVTIPSQFRAAIESPPPAAPVAPAPAPVPAPQATVPVAPPPAPVVQAAPPPAAVQAPVAIDKQVKEMSPYQRAELAFRKGVALLQESRASAAEASFREALREDPTHVAARQALLGLLLDARRNDEAEQLLRTTLEMNPRQPRHAMVLARLEVDRGDVPGAVNTLVASLPYVQSDAEYFAFLAALLQREGRHRETVDYYRAALQIAPGNGLWQMGLGISLRATGQSAEAREAFQKAIETRQLNAELQAFTEKQLRELGTARK